MTDLGTRLGPRARAMLAQCMEAIMKAGRLNKDAKLPRHIEYAVGVIETAMIVDAAEAAALPPAKDAD